MRVFISAICLFLACNVAYTQEQPRNDPTIQQFQSLDPWKQFTGPNHYRNNTCCFCAQAIDWRLSGQDGVTEYGIDLNGNGIVDDNEWIAIEDIYIKDPVPNDDAPGGVSVCDPEGWRRCVLINNGFSSLRNDFYDSPSSARPLREPLRAAAKLFLIFLLH